MTKTLIGQYVVTMRIEELNPEKFYAVIIENEHASTQDLERVAERLREGGANAVVLTDNSRIVSLGQPLSYWGIYFPDSKRWLQKHDGEVYYYPSAGIAAAHLETHVSDMVLMSGPDYPQREKVVVKEMEI